MKTNLYKEVEDELTFFVEKFKEIGWDQEDSQYIFKRTDFITNPDANNDSYKYGFGMVLYSELLSYTEDRKYILTPWVCVRIAITIDKDVKYLQDSQRLRQIAKFVKSEIEKTGYKPFYDEDAFMGIFSIPEKNQRLDSMSFKFYLNKDYPKGYWENHTI